MNSTKKPACAFRGLDGKVYEIDVHPISLLRVQDRLEIDLLELVLGPLATALADSPEHLASACHLLACPDENPEEFSANISGADVFPAMAEALISAVINYLPKNHGRYFKSLAG